MFAPNEIGNMHIIKNLDFAQIYVCNDLRYLSKVVQPYRGDIICIENCRNYYM